jgi:adenosine deaminase
VSVNTDDPALLGASLVGQYALCRQAFGWTDEVTKEVARTSIEARFANEDVKTGLLERLTRFPSTEPYVEAVAP